MGEIRRFETGATRDQDANKLNFEGFEAAIVRQRYAEYMHKHRQQSDGSLRAADNWQAGFPVQSCMESMARHFQDVCLEYDGYPSRDGLEDALCAVIFNAKAYLLAVLRERNYGRQSSDVKEKSLDAYRSSMGRADQPTIITPPDSGCALVSTTGSRSS
jgi:hypothetical protein